MKELKFNKKSWHYLIATKITKYEPPRTYTYADGKVITYNKDSANICAYSNAVLFGVLVLLVLLAAVVVLSVLIIHVVLGIYFSLLMSQWFFSEVGIVGVSLLVTSLAFYGLFRFIEYRQKRSDEEYFSDKPKQDNFIKGAYKAWKQKFCVPISFIE